MKQINKDTISLEWTTDDCRYVLKLMLDKHDETIGVSWDVMDVYIDKVIEDKNIREQVQAHA